MRLSLKLHILASVILPFLLACRPVLAIGWEEIFLLLVLVGLLFGPGLLRFYKFWRKMKTDTKKDPKQVHKEA